MPHKPIQFKDLSLSFPQKNCFENFTTQIHYGDRIGLIGKNGCGKSTFLKAIQGSASLLEGALILPEDALIGYLPQLIDTHQSLSGSERLHKTLTQALALKPNILLLDEPTNHLDQRNRKSFMRLIQSFPGTLIIASHDGALLTSCVEIVWHIDQGKIRIFSGNYQDYRQEMDQTRARVENEFLLLSREKKPPTTRS